MPRGGQPYDAGVYTNNKGARVTGRKQGYWAEVKATAPETHYTGWYVSDDGRVQQVRMVNDRIGATDEVRYYDAAPSEPHYDELPEPGAGREDYDNGVDGVYVLDGDTYAFVGAAWPGPGWRKVRGEYSDAESVSLLKLHYPLAAAAIDYVSDGDWDPRSREAAVALRGVVEAMGRSRVDEAAGLDRDLRAQIKQLDIAVEAFDELIASGDEPRERYPEYARILEHELRWFSDHANFRDEMTVLTAALVLSDGGPQEDLVQTPKELSGLSRRMKRRQRDHERQPAR